MAVVKVHSNAALIPINRTPKLTTCCTRYVHKPKDTNKHEHFIKHLVSIVVRDILPTYSFDVLIEATIDAASPRILLNFQSSALAIIRPFGSQPLSIAVVE
ncbi:hypothetical protein BHE74_00042331 [Ensete ventricosum]|nr:hypothetical protein BHE74_00042331 [Ensete ventricosum]